MKLTGFVNTQQTVFGEVLTYVIAPLLVAILAALIFGIFRWARHVEKRLNLQDKALAVLVQQVAPPGQPSLADLLSTTRIQVATLQGQLAQHGAQVSNTGGVT